MKDFTLQLIFMLLGFTLPILFRALNHAGTKFDLLYFLKDNVYRWGIGGIALVVIQTLLFFEGDGIIEGMKSFGVIVPILASSVIGFGVAWLVVKSIPTAK